MPIIKYKENEIESPSKASDDTSLVKSSQTVIKDGNYFYNQYWQCQQNSIYLKNANVLEIYKACQHLMMSAVMGHSAAKADLRFPNDVIMAHGFQAQLEKEFCARLLELSQKSKNYHDARNSQFMLAYSHKYRTIYRNYVDRYKEIFIALTYLNEAAPQLIKNLKVFADSMNMDFPLSYETQKAHAWKILIFELIGLDPLINGTQKMGSPYPFRIVSINKFKEIVRQTLVNQVEIDEVVKHYQDFLNENVVYVNCQKSGADKFHLSLTQELLDSANNKILCFVDKADGAEIARIERSDDFLMLKGYGDKLSVKISGETNCSTFILENKEGEIKLNANFNLQQPLYLSSDAKSFIVDNALNSKHDIKIDCIGDIHFNKDSAITSVDDISIRADAISLDCHINSDKKIHIEARGEFNLSDTATIHAKGVASVSASVFKDIRGEIISDESLRIKSADGIYLKRAAMLYGKKGLSLTAKSMMSSDKAVVKTDKHGEIKVYHKLVLEDETNWKATAFKIKSDVIENYSNKIEADKIFIHCGDVMRNHPTGVITTQESLTMHGGSVWNGGKLKFGKNLTMKLNRFYVHGIATLEWSELRDAVKNSSLEGDSINIVAGVVIGALGSVYAHSQSIAAIATVGADFSLTKNSKKSRLVSLECSVDLPNLPVIYKDICECFHTFQKGEYLNAFKSAVSWSSFSNAISVARWVVRLLQPGAGQVVDIVWSFLMLLWSLPSLYKQCDECYQKYKSGVEIQPSDLYQIIATAGGIGIQIFNMEGMVANTVAEGVSNGFSESSITGDIPALIVNFVSMFVSTTTDDAVVGISASGVSANGSLIRRNIWSYEIWHGEVALNTTHSFQYATENHQLTIANNVSQIGGDLNRSGYEIANNDFTNLTNQTDSIHLIAKKAYWQAQNITENADIHADVIQMHASQQLEHDGNLNASVLASLSGQSVTTGIGSHVSGVNVVMEGGTIHHNGDADASQIVINATDSADLSKTSSNNAEKMFVSGHDVLQDSHITITQSDQVQEAPPAEAKSSDAKDNAPAVTPALYIHADNQLTCGENGQITATHSTVLLAGNSIHDDSHIAAQDVFMTATDNITLSEKADTTAQKFYATADNVVQDSTIHINNQQEMKIEHKPSTSTVINKNNNDSDAYDPNLYIEAKHDLKIGNHSNITGKKATVYLKAMTITDSGNKDVAHVIEQAKDKLTIESKSETKAETVVFESEGEIEFEGAIHINKDKSLEQNRSNKNAGDDQKDDDSKSASTPDVYIHGHSVNMSRSAKIDAILSTVVISGDNTSVDGAITANVVVEKAKEKLDVGVNAETKAQTVSYDSDNVVNIAGHLQINKPASSDNAADTKQEDDKATVTPDVYIHGKTVNIEASSQMDATNSTIYVTGDNVTDNGHATASHVIEKATDHLDIGVNAVTTAQVVSYDSDNAVSIAGHLRVNKPAATGDAADTKQDDDKSSLTPDVYVHGKTVNIEASSQIDATNATVYVTGDNVTDNGHTTADHVIEKATDHLDIGANAVTTAQAITYDSDNAVNIAGHLHINNPASSGNAADTKQDDDKSSLTPDVYVHGKSVNMDASSQIDATNATVYVTGDNVTDNGHTTAGHVIEKATDRLDIGVSANVTAQSISYDSDNVVSVAGHLAIHKSESPPDQKTSEDKSALTPDIYVHGKNVTMSGNIDAEKNTVFISGDNINESSQMHVGTLIETASQHLDVASPANHVGDVISYQADTASLQGSATAKTVDLHIDHGLDVNAVLSHTGSTSRINAQETVSIETKESVSLNQNYNFKTNVSLTAAGISVDHKTIHSDKSLELKSTNADIAIQHSQLTANESLSLDSAGSLISDHSVLSAGVLNVHAQSNILNIAGTMQAAHYLQVVSEHGDIKNIGELEIKHSAPTPQKFQGFGHNGDGLFKNLDSYLNKPNDVPVYHSAQMLGGDGQGFDGVGAYIKADQKLINQGSVIDSQSGLYAEGKRGIENTSYSYSYKPNLHTGNSRLDGLLQRIMPPVTKTVGSQLGGHGNVQLRSDASIINSYSFIHGDVTSIQAQGNIINHAGIIASSQYLEMVAGGNIENQCVESDYQGRYDTMKKYDIGHIYGGNGAGHDGLGLFMQAGNKIINDASEIISRGDNYLSGRNGIFSTARYHEYTSYYRHDETWYGKETTTEDRSYQVQAGLIYSVNGSNTLVSENGGIYSVSTNFLAAKDNNFSAHDSIKLYGLVLNDKEYKDRSNLWGLDDEETNQVDDYAVPTVISNPGNTRIVSLADVDMPNTAILAGGQVSIEAKNIYISAPTLNHSYSVKSRGLGFSSPVMNLGGASPLIGDYYALTHSGCGGEYLANGWNLAFDGLNSANNLLTNLQNGTTQQSFLSNFLSANFSYTHSEMSSSWQTVAPNVGIQCGSLSLKAENEIDFANGIPVIVAGDASITAKIFNQTGARLNSVTSNSSQSVSLGLSAGADPHVGASVSGSVSRSTRYANQIFTVGGQLTVNADQWNLSDANVFAGSLKGQVDSVSIISHLNTSSTHAWSASADTNGSFSVQNSQYDSALIGLASGINTTGALDFTARYAYLEGGKIVGGAGSHVSIDTVKVKTVDEYSRGTSIGISGNFNDFTGSNSNQGMSSVGISLGNQDYSASQTSTIYIPDNNGLHLGHVSGDLNTANDSGLHVESDDHFAVQVKVPIFSAKSVEQIKDNLSWATQRLFSSAKTPVYSQSTSETSISTTGSQQHEAKESRLERWKGDEYKGLTDDTAVSKWSRALFSMPAEDKSVVVQEPGEESSTFVNRAWGLAQFLGGGGQVVSGVIGGVFLSETGVGAVVGGIVAYRGLDNMKAGALTLYTGERTETNLGSILTGYGMSDTSTELFEGLFDFMDPEMIPGSYRIGKYFYGIAEEAATRSRILKNIDLDRKAIESSNFNIHVNIEESLRPGLNTDLNNININLPSDYNYSNPFRP